MGLTAIFHGFCGRRSEIHWVPIGYQHGLELSMGLALQEMTVEEFLAWEESQTDRHEFYRGEVFAMVGATARHNRVEGVAWMFVDQTNSAEMSLQSIDLKIGLDVVFRGVVGQ
jgi:hypothetical protein